MKFNEFPFIRYTIFFVAGVLLYPIAKFLSYGAILFGLLSSLIAYIGLTLAYVPQKRTFFKVLLPFFAYLSLLFAGLYVTSLRDVNLIPDHLIHFSYIKG